jgi:hypothetical protein
MLSLIYKTLTKSNIKPKTTQVIQNTTASTVIVDGKKIPPDSVVKIKKNVS